MSTLAITPYHFTQTAMPVSTQLKRASTSLQKIWAVFENTVWKYIKESGKVVKNTLKLVILAGTKHDVALGKIITKIGFLSVVSCFLTIKNFPSDLKAIDKSVKLHDDEGIALSSMAAVISPLDALDSFMTVATSLTELGIIPKIALFSLIGLPVAITLVGFASFRSIYDLVTLSIHLHQLPKKIDAANLEQVKAEIQAKIDITEADRKRIRNRVVKQNASLSEENIEKLTQKKLEVLKDKKISKLSRRTDVKIVNIWKNLQKHLDQENPDLTVANAALRDIKTLNVRKLAVTAFASAINLTLCGCLITSLAVGLSPFVIPSVSVARALIMIGKQYYTQVWFDKGLERPAFARA